MQITSKLLFLGAAIHLLLPALPLSAAVSVNLSHPSATSQPVGTAVTWTATNAGSASITLQYRWVIAQNGVNVVFRDFNTTSTISYAPLQEGLYTVSVTARDAHNLSDTDTDSFTYAASPLLAGSTPKVTATHNPLVAIYSATCPSGSKIRVFFAPNGTLVTSGFATPIQPCVSGKSVNFIIAGMRANTTYKLAHQIQTGFTFSFGPMLQFTTGSVPRSVPAPKVTITGSPTTQQPVLLYSAIIPNVQPIGFRPLAFDTSGHLIWYDSPGAGEPAFLNRPVNGGTLLLGGGTALQEIDLLGNVLRETTITRVNQQLSGPPFNIVNASIPNRVAGFDHDAVRLPNGNTAAIATLEQLAVQDPKQGRVDVVGDVLLVLDKNFQVVWAWNAFSHLDVRRKATLNDTCAGPPGCAVLTLIPPGQTLANDWLHGNSLTFTGDGDLLFSIRNQDWVIKVHYANATGTANGEILWRLGNQGDFA